VKGSGKSELTGKVSEERQEDVQGKVNTTAFDEEDGDRRN